jgi:hypothetical protein
MANLGIEIPPEVIADFCRKHHIRKLSFFGSVLGNTFAPESDIDVLVEFKPDHIPGFELIRTQGELSVLLGGRKVDLVTPKFLNRRIRNRILADAEVQYAEG